MKNRFLLSEITDEHLKEFMEFSEKEGVKEIFIDSPGGYTYASDSITYIINSNPEEYHVVVAGRCFSAAFNLLIDVLCNRTVLDSATAGIHLTNWEVGSRELKDNNSEAHFLFTKMDPIKVNKYLTKYSSFLSDEQLERVRNGGTIFMTSEELKALVEPA